LADRHRRIGAKKDGRLASRAGRVGEYPTNPGVRALELAGGGQGSIKVESRMLVACARMAFFLSPLHTFASACLADSMKQSRFRKPRRDTPASLLAEIARSRVRDLPFCEVGIVETVM
jgi:hypothetical protein